MCKLMFWQTWLAQFEGLTSGTKLLNNNNMMDNDGWTAGTAENPAANKKILFCDIQIKVVISRSQIYVYHKDLLQLKI